ncbi:MAG: DEAD/DEAH box helicase [Syntrophales bacterium]|jgi:superfamily II RNA helicase|nr:DEAD/DEAH box helicase [Syntrophales bacterium]MDY0044969.1 DEAD/DEAH box helicase [Syntrophales bacterium]
MAEVQKYYNPREEILRHRRQKENVQTQKRLHRQKAKHFHRMKAEIEPELKSVLSRIGKPEAADFVPDPFQTDALKAITKTDCLVSAPTGSGKTWIAQEAIAHTLANGGRCWYASPLKALSNAKWVEFGNIFGPEKVGILTGDTKENAEAPVIVGTTEILRNQLYDAMHTGEMLNCNLVILDEAHFLGDEDRGVVWEEVMIYLPARINMLLLSATIGNSGEIAGWLESIRNKRCVVIEETKRPVPLYPLFLHPSGRILPLLANRSLHGKVAAYIEKSGQSTRFRRLEPFDDILGVLKEVNLLPALFFLKSREECNAAVACCRRYAIREDKEPFEKELENYLEKHPFLKDHKQLWGLKKLRVGAHHGGQLPAWKFLVEHMMKSGYLDAVFATSTVAAGVNFPARTVVLFNSDRYNGHEFIPLDATAFHQMTGRAGRRGLDKIGFMVAFPGRFMDLYHIRSLLAKRPGRISSQIKNDFSMVLNLLLSHRPDEIRIIFEASLADFQPSRKRKPQSRSLWQEFNRYLAFLKQEGYVDDRYFLTEKGIWTSQLRLDQPILISQCVEEKVFPEQDPVLLAAVVAPFVYDRSQDIALAKTGIPKKLRRAYSQIIHAVKPVAERMENAGFEVSPLFPWPALAIYHWSRGLDWNLITRTLRIADGDLAMLVTRTADNLQQIASLADTHPKIASCAIEAKKRIMREPVLFE